MQIVLLVALVLTLNAFGIASLIRSKQRVKRMLIRRIRERTRELEKKRAALRRVNKEYEIFFARSIAELHAQIVTLKGILNTILTDKENRENLQQFEKLNHALNDLDDLVYRLIWIGQPLISSITERNSGIASTQEGVS